MLLNHTAGLPVAWESVTDVGFFKKNEFKQNWIKLFISNILYQPTHARLANHACGLPI
jgi:hypothetical protein